MRRPGEVLSRFQLLEHAWDYEYENRSNVVDSYVRLLRRKIDKPFGVESIETVRGAGYRLREDGGAMSRIPIRMRMTLAFALASAVVLAALGYFVYARFDSELSEQIDQSLRSHGDDIASLVAGGDLARNAKLLGREESFAQVLTADGGVYATDTPTRFRPAAHLRRHRCRGSRRT